MARVWLIQAVV